jgi:hypothetical protein
LLLLLLLLVALLAHHCRMLTPPPPRLCPLLPRPALAFRSARNPVSNDRSVRFTTDPLSARGMDTIRLLPNNGMR